MASQTTQGHDYHLVDPSPWPLVASVGALALALGFLAGMQGYGYAWMVPGVLIVGYVMFFVAWFWAYFNAAFFPPEAMGGTWPPKGIEVFDPWHLPFMNTLILLLSGTTVTWAHHALVEGNRKGFIQGLVLTVILGAFFSCVQAYEYHHAAFAFKDGIYASTFYMATGFHGAHVLIGTIFLLVCLLRGLAGHFTPKHHFGFEAAAWYWHFVDVVWLFLFVAIYWWGAGGTAHHG